MTHLIHCRILLSSQKLITMNKKKWNRHQYNNQRPKSFLRLEFRSFPQMYVQIMFCSWILFAYKYSFYSDDHWIVRDNPYLYFYNFVIYNVWCCVELIGLEKLLKSCVSIARGYSKSKRFIKCKRIKFIGWWYSLPNN